MEAHECCFSHRVFGHKMCKSLKKGNEYISLLLTEAKRSDEKEDQKYKAGQRQRKENCRNTDVEKAGKTYHF